MKENGGGQMFRKILIANRGEIAVRIIRTCQEMRIKTVAVYSEADADSLHVRLADEAHLIGKAHVNKSYLNMDNILKVAQDRSVDAIHPGYGLLSENPDFAYKCEELGIAFIGPSSTIIARMGNKIEARKEMKKANVPVIPGVDYPLHDEEKAISVANEIGYPVMLKASAGGGGIGLEIIKSDSELRAAYSGNQKRATKFFGNGDMYLEKYIKNPRHIEIQVLADKNHSIIHLWERECSIQRRHQKVIEEAPSPFLDEKTRIQMGEIAVTAAKSIGYVNAGTIEFLVDEDRNFYFLEMNTRLQVEHTVTEEITGIDLIKEQIKIAAGKDLSFSQKDIRRSGHAIEVRIYAEDSKSFLPSPGEISKLRLPFGDYIRHELAVSERSIVTPFYDPMIAKLIVKGASRTEAINRMNEALNHYVVKGIKTNIEMLKNVIQHEAFKKGLTTTNFIEEYFKMNTKI